MAAHRTLCARTDGSCRQETLTCLIARALGWMQMLPGMGEYRLLDVHGAGAQHSDPKNGGPAGLPRGRGPQGDVIRINNFVRCVRTGRVDCGRFSDEWGNAV